MGALLLDVRGGDNLSGQVEPLAQVVETLGGEGVVVCEQRPELASISQVVACRGGIFRGWSVGCHVHQRKLGELVGGARTVLPRELGLDVATRGQGLHSLDDEQVLDGDLGVLGEVVVLLGDEDSLTEESLWWTQLISQNVPSSIFPRTSKSPPCRSSLRSPSFRRMVYSSGREDSMLEVVLFVAISLNLRQGC